MLTESEREWLEDREYARYHYSCQWCSQYDPMLIMPDRQNVPCMWHTTCPCHTNNYDYKDALEFSERVAAKLADSISNELNFVSGKSVVQEAVEYRGKRHTIAWARLKLARLKVEEEMDGEQKP